MKRIADLLGEAASGGGEYRAVIIHANREQEAYDWKAELEKELRNVEFMIGYFGPVIGTHLGEGSMGLGWYKK